MSNIIEEYEKWWINELDTYHQNGFWDRLRIDETRGTNIKDIGFILNKVKDFIKQYIGKPYERIHSVTQIITKTIDFSNDNVFIKDLTLVLKPYKRNENNRISGSYSQSMSEYDGNTDKMYNNRITLFGESSTQFVIDIEALDETLWHELHHAYRQYCLLKENYNKGVASNYKNDNYNKLYSSTTELPIEYGELGVTVREMYYVSNQNEIDAHMQEMIPYIEKHKEMNFSNYKSHLKNIKAYKFLNDYKTLLEICEQLCANKRYKNFFGEIIRSLYARIPKYYELKWTNEQYVNSFHNRMKKMYLYAEHQFYKVLYYTMDEYGRRNVNEIALHTMIHDDSFEKILENHKKDIERMTKEMLPLDKLITFN